MKIAIHGIPSCGTCKKARAWLDARGLAYTWVDLREQAPSRARVVRWVKTLGAKKLRNTSGGSYRALGTAKDGFDDAAWTDAFAADPMLIKRPVLEVDGAPVAVGFDVSAWAVLLGADA